MAKNLQIGDKVRFTHEHIMLYRELGDLQFTILSLHGFGYDQRAEFVEVGKSREVGLPEGANVRVLELVTQPSTPELPFQPGDHVQSMASFGPIVHHTHYVVLACFFFQPDAAVVEFVGLEGRRFFANDFKRVDLATPEPAVESTCDSASQPDAEPSEDEIKRVFAHLQESDPLRLLTEWGAGELGFLLSPVYQDECEISKEKRIKWISKLLSAYEINIDVEYAITVTCQDDESLAESETENREEAA